MHRARRSLVCRASMLVAVLLVVPATALAQPSPLPDTEPFVFPRLMVSLGLGSTTSVRDRQPIQTLSVQFLPARHLSIEGDVSYWTEQWDFNHPGSTLYNFVGQPVGFTGNYFDRGERDSWSAGINVMFRTEPRRLTWYVGGGPVSGIVRQRAALGAEGCTALKGFESRCSQPYEANYSRSQPGLRALTGVDVLIGHGIRAFGDVQFTSLDDAYVRLSAGVRVDVLKQSAAMPARTRAARLAGTATPAAAASGAVGSNVRVTFAGGKRVERRLVELSSDALVLERHGKELRYPLDQVLIIEAARHSAAKGAIVGTIGGFLIGSLGVCGSGGGDVDCWLGGLVFGVMGASAGAGMGAGIDHASTLAHVIYVAPPATASTVRVAPIASAGRAGAVLSLGW